MMVELTVNGFVNRISVDDRFVEEQIRPLMEKMAAGYERTGRRQIVFLAGPPAAGKSTLALLMEHLGNESGQGVRFQALSMDGFHYPSGYLSSHETVIGDRRILLKDIKGSPETYDVDGLCQLLSHIDECRCKGTDPVMRWPGYDRTIHDVVPDQYEITGQVLVIEGNYLLLDREPWAGLRRFADLTVFVKDDEAILKKRLIGRKIRGGKTPSEAQAWYRNTDEPNIRTVLYHSTNPDIIIGAV